MFNAISTSEEKAMATHSSTLAWQIPGTGEPGGLLSLGSHRVWSDLAAAAAATLETLWKGLLDVVPFNVKSFGVFILLI